MFITSTRKRKLRDKIARRRKQEKESGKTHQLDYHPVLVLFNLVSYVG